MLSSSRIRGYWPDSDGQSAAAWGHTMREMRSWAQMVDAQIGAPEHLDMSITGDNFKHFRGLDTSSTTA